MEGVLCPLFVNVARDSTMQAMTRCLIVLLFSMLCLALNAEAPKLVGEGGRVGERPGLKKRGETPSLEAESERLLDLLFRISTEYDNNVKLSDGARNKEDARLVFGTDAGLHLPKLYGVETTLSYKLYKDVYYDLTEFDLESHTLGVTVGRDIFESFHAFLDYSWIYYFFDGDDYQRSHFIAPSLFWSQSDSFAAFIRGSWTNNKYFQEIVDTLSGNEYSLSFREYFLFGPEKKRNIWLEYNWERNETKEDYEQYTSHSLSAGLSSPLWWRTTLDLDFSYTWSRYRDGDPNYGDSRRKDNVYEVNISLSRPIYKEKVKGRAYYILTEQVSNIGARDYTDNILGFEVEIRFW